MRLKGVIAYDGSRFEGFQRQSHTPRTVVGNLNEALRSVGIETTVVGSGRTDKGVHATAQVIHFDVPAYWDSSEKLRRILNRHLKAISIKRLYRVKETFHARFDAKRRLYRYIFTLQERNVFERAYISRYLPFDTLKLQEALRLFLGRHDFAYFHKSGSNPSSTTRTVYRADYYRHGPYHIIIFEANAFLRSQVRMMIEAAVKTARNEISLRELQEQIEAKARHSTDLAPPQGLYLARVIYPIS